VPFRVRVGAKGLREVEHGSQLLAFGPQGRSSLLWLTGGTSPADLAHDIALLADGVTPA
jgi:hypothetical protein